MIIQLYIVIHHTFISMCPLNQLIPLTQHTFYSRRCRSLFCCRLLTCFSRCHHPMFLNKNKKRGKYAAAALIATAAALIAAAATDSENSRIAVPNT